MQNKENLSTLKPVTKKMRIQNISVQRTGLLLMALATAFTQYYFNVYASVEVPETLITLINIAIVIIGVGLAVRGLIVMIPGIGDYVGAEDDDAAAKKKGRDQITSGVKLMIVGAVIIAVGASGMVGNAVQGLADLIQIG